MNLEILALRSGKFHGAEQRWSVAELEASAILKAVHRDAPLLESVDGLLILSDHRSLIYLLDLANAGALGTVVASKFQRWAAKLSCFDYELRHIPGVDNVAADVLSRHGPPDPLQPPEPKRADVADFRVPLHAQRPAARFHGDDRRSNAVAEATMASRRLRERPLASLTPRTGPSPDWEHLEATIAFLQNLRPSHGAHGECVDGTQVVCPTATLAVTTRAQAQRAREAVAPADPAAPD